MTRQYRVWVLSAALAATACSAVPEVNYFTLAYTILPDETGRKPLADAVYLRELDIVPAYDQDKIVYRYSPFQFQYYNYMVWAVKPHRMVTRLIKRHLEQRGLFRAIMLELDQERPRYEMTGTLEAIEELDSGNEWYAHLAFSLRLSSGDRTVWSHRSDARKRVYNRAPVYVIQALSELLEAELEKISASLAERLKSEPAEKGP